MGAGTPNEPYGVRDFKAEFGGKLWVKWQTKAPNPRNDLKDLKGQRQGEKKAKNLHRSRKIITFAA